MCFSSGTLFFYLLNTRYLFRVLIVSSLVISLFRIHSFYLCLFRHFCLIFIMHVISFPLSIYLYISSFLFLSTFVYFFLSLSFLLPFSSNLCLFLPLFVFFFLSLSFSFYISLTLAGSLQHTTKLN